MSPDKIVYVSCDPETLARDLRKFSDNNYSVKELTPVDLFSRTPHVETVARLVKE
jgi:23S rRNA (uracil1939-C5)-methyltransferase